MIEDKEKLIGERVQVIAKNEKGMYARILRVWENGHIDIKSEFDPKRKCTVKIDEVRFLNDKLEEEINGVHEGEEIDKRIKELKIKKTNFFPKLCGIPSGSYHAILKKRKLSDETKAKIEKGFKSFEEMCLEDKVDLKIIDPEQESEDKEEEVEEMKEQVEDISFKEKIEEARLEKESNNMNLLNRALKQELGLQKWIELMDIAKQDYKVIMDAFNS